MARVFAEASADPSPDLTMLRRLGQALIRAREVALAA
jgi:hypothetical protein